jgi:hypothetical protein
MFRLVTFNLTKEVDTQFFKPQIAYKFLRCASPRIANRNFFTINPQITNFLGMSLRWSQIRKFLAKDRIKNFLKKFASFSLFHGETIYNSAANSFGPIWKGAFWSYLLGKTYLIFYVIWICLKSAKLNGYVNRKAANCNMCWRTTNQRRW